MAGNPYSQANSHGSGPSLDAGGQHEILEGFDQPFVQPHSAPVQPRPPVHTGLPTPPQGPIPVSMDDLNSALNSGFQSAEKKRQPVGDADLNYDDIKYFVTSQDDGNFKKEIWGRKPKHKLRDQIIEAAEGQPGTYRVQELVGYKTKPGQYAKTNVWFEEIEDDAYGGDDDTQNMQQLIGAMGSPTVNPAIMKAAAVDPGIAQLLIATQANSQQQLMQIIPLLIANKQEKERKDDPPANKPSIAETVTAVATAIGAALAPLAAVGVPLITAFIDKMSSSSTQAAEMMKVGMELAQNAGKPNWLELFAMGAAGVAQAVPSIVATRGATMPPALPPPMPPPALPGPVPTQPPVATSQPPTTAKPHPYNILWRELGSAMTTNNPKLLHPGYWVTRMASEWDDALVANFLQVPDDRLVAGFNQVTHDLPLTDAHRKAMPEIVKQMKAVLHQFLASETGQPQEQEHEQGPFDSADSDESDEDQMDTIQIA